jgi:hypothetical protein
MIFKEKVLPEQGKASGIHIPEAYCVIYVRYALCGTPPFYEPVESFP